MGYPAFTPAQWTTLYALTSTVIPALPAAALQPRTALSAAVCDRFAASSADASSVEFRAGLERLVDVRLPNAAKSGIGLILTMLNSTSGCLLLTNSTTPFHKQLPAERERLMQMWTSPSSYLLFPPMRAFAFAIMQLTKVTWLRNDTATVYPAIGWHDGVGRVNSWAQNDHWKNEVPEIKPGEESGFYDKWDFIDVPKQAGGKPFELETDVVIVGSGCGGAVAAKTIAEAGFSVIMVEKGTWVPTDQLPLPEYQASETMFENGMSTSSTDGGITVVSGSTFGGGGTINWGASLQTQHFVRRQWAEEHNLPFFLSASFQAHLDAVCTRMSVTEPTNHNHRNATLLAGAQKLGYAAMPTPQNSLPAHSDSTCTFGCGHISNARKQGPTQSFLPDASRAGARFITSFNCDTILFSSARKSTAIGISGTYGVSATPVIIRAKQVVVSAGTINTPGLLMRSGLKNSHIGQNLHLHPASYVYASFPQKCSPEEGSPLTSIVTSFENLDNAGHGVRLETPMMSPAMGLTSLPWSSAAAWKNAILNYQHLASFITIVREKNTGTITIDSSGRTCISYTIGAPEKSWTMTGIEALARIAYIQGADTIWSPVIGFPPFVRGEHDGSRDDALPPGTNTLEVDAPGIMDPPFVEWLKRLKDMGLPTPGTMFSSAHQMASCRMSAEEADGVVDPVGRVWNVDRLVIADASVLPSASGVNPMITVMAVAAWVAEGVVERLRAAGV